MIIFGLLTDRNLHQNNFMLIEKLNYEIRNSTHLKRHDPTTVHCELCDYGTYDKVSLKIHVMQNHTFERPFKCDLCEFATTLKLRFTT